MKGPFSGAAQQAVHGEMDGAHHGDRLERHKSCTGMKNLVTRGAEKLSIAERANKGKTKKEKQKERKKGCREAVILSRP